jgi:hypothetical protein
MAHTCNLSPKEFKVILGYTARPCLKKKKKKTRAGMAAYACDPSYAGRRGHR